MTNQPDFTQLHRVIMMIALDFHAFCERHNVTYYLMGGTALGAMRHGGFIPWDDDFDVFMDRKNYLRFMQACENHLDRERYYLQREDTKEWPLFFSKIRLNDTRYVEADTAGTDIHEGIYIDIMCLHTAYQNKTLRYMQFFCARVLSASALANRGYTTQSTPKKLALMVARWLNIAPIKKTLLWFVRRLEGKNTGMVGHFFGRAPFHATSFPTEFLGTPRMVPYEQDQLPVPQNVEAYLTTRFGPNYMAPPSQAVKDSFPSHAVQIDLGPYKE